MKKEIRILFVEDLPADVVMVNHELRRAGLAFRSKRVETREAFLYELEHHSPDLILSDHGLPCFDGFTALAIAREKCPEVPFIFVTNSLGEQTTIETFESGATDYVLKENLGKLVPAVQRALREAEQRSAAKHKERELRESEERFRMLVEGVKDYAIFMLDTHGRVTSWNAGAQWLHGFPAEEVMGRHFSLFYTRQEIERGVPEGALKAALGEGRFEEEGLRMGKGGRTFDANVVITALRDSSGRLRGFVHVTRNISERVQARAALQRSEERYKRLVELCPDALLVVHTDGQIAYCNSAAMILLGATRTEQILNKSLRDLLPPEDGAEALETILHAQEQGASAPFIEAEFVRMDGTRVDVEMSATPLTYKDQPAMQVIAHDITERRQVEEVLRKSEARKSAILDSALDGIISMNHKGVVEEWNLGAQKIFGYSRAEAMGKELAELVIPAAARAAHREGLARYLSTGKGKIIGRHIEMTARRADGSEFPAELSVVRVPESDPPMFTGFVRDITERSQAEAALHESEFLKGIILETALDAIISIDRHGLIREWNPAAVKVFGYSRAEALGRRMDELIIPDSLREAYQDGLANYLMTGVGSLLGRPIELTLKRANGTEFRAEAAISRLPTEDPPFCTALIRDITERKEAEAALRESEERFRMLVECVTDYAIYMLDPEGRVATWNSGAERIEGYQSDEIIGKHLSTFFTSEDIERDVPGETLRRAEREGRALTEGWRVRKDGSRFWTRGTLTAVRDETGGLCGFAKVAQDMTRQKQAEEEIRRLNTELEQRVQERTAELQAANRELEAFSYSVSHDLRAPLRHIGGYIDILQMEAGEQLDEANRQYLQTIAASAKQLGDLIDALLAFSRMGRAEMRQEPISLATLVEESRRELRRDTQGRDIDWRIGELPEVHGDPLMLRQVIINLLSNALKYTRNRPRAEIEIGATVNEQETIFFVRDNGVGFDPQYATKLFGVFQRLHRSSEFEGTGIGLANVQRIITRHGGRVWAESALDRGATFYFSLPHPPKGTT